MRRIHKLLTMMSGGGADEPGAAMQAAILATSPIAYWPLDDATGPTVRDATGNNRTGTISEGTGTITLGISGQRGKCFRFPGVNENNNMIISSAALTAALDPKEYAVAMLVKVETDPALQVRLVNTWTNSTQDYSALEVRNSTELGAFLKENAVTQTIGYTTLGNVVDAQWHLIVFFNSESTGNCGVYFDKEYRPGVRSLTLPGTTTAVSANFPQVGMELGGLLQHVIFWNRVPTQSEVDGLYDAAFGAAAPWSLSYILRDDFTTDDAAPITSPRTCEPGPGTFTATDSASVLSISTDKLRWAAFTSAGDPRLVSGAITRATCRALVAKVTAGRLYTGFAANTTGAPTEASIMLHAARLHALINAGQIDLEDAAAGQEYSIAIVLRRMGAYFMVKGGAFTNWTPVYIDAQEYDATLYAVICAVSAVATAEDTIRVCDLPSSAWGSFGLASTRIAGAVDAGDTFTHDANCSLDLTVYALPTAGNVIDLRFRQQDATNYWQVTIDSSGALVLNEVVAGTPTARGTKAAAIAANSRIFIKAYGQTIQGIYVTGTNKIVAWTYASATNFVTETDGELAGEGGGSVGDLIVWPRTVPAASAAYLDQALA